MDDGDWRCVQCGQYYYGQSPDSATGTPREAIENSQPLKEASHREPMARPSSSGRASAKRSGGRSRAKYDRDIGSLIESHATAESKWWERNRHIVDHLDNGLSIAEIAALTSRGKREIRSIRERLFEMRAANGTG